MLQLSYLELTKAIETELLENPFLAKADESERADDHAATPGSNDVDAHNDDDSPVDAPDSPYGITSSGEGAAPHPERDDDRFSPVSLGSTDSMVTDHHDTYDRINSIRQPRTLREFLFEQINQEFRLLHERNIAIILVDELDETGYMQSQLEPLAARLGVEVTDITSVLSRIRGFDPAGIFAESLADCLAIQLDRLALLTPPMRILLNHLPLLASGQRRQLMRLCNVASDELDELVRQLRRADPKPGIWSETSLIPVLIPDVVMRNDMQGGWHIDISDQTLPSLRVDQEYYQRMHTQAKPQDRAYLRNRWSNANWYLRTIRQRNETILRIAAEIVYQQSEFFRAGMNSLVPLTMREVAESVAMHESTVSRAVNKKYIATPRGIFELRFFFTTPISSSESGKTYASASVRCKIRDLVQNEPSDRPLSDQAIVALLQREGIAIARRTVTKYREAMQIASSTERRRQKAFANDTSHQGGSEIS